MHRREENNLFGSSKLSCHNGKKIQNPQIPNSMKIPALLLASVLAAPLFGNTVYTIPSGYTKITVAGPAVSGQSKLTAISASLLRDVEYSGAVTIGAYTDNPTGPDSQDLTVTGAAWTATQWTDTPHLAYISVADDPGNADGIAPAEEAFLITGNTAAGGLTLETGFDLATRFPATTTIKIRKANTLDSFFGSSSSSFSANDLIYIWGGTKWDSFQYIDLGGGLAYWASTTDGFTDVGPITIIHPDEGVFVSRTVDSDIVITLFGEVPSAPQISSIEGTSFVASRFPIDTTLGNTGIANSNWTASDLLYIWNQDASPSAKWDSFQYVDLGGGSGYWASTTDGFTPVDNTVIAANSAMFVVRASEVTGENSGTTSILPYTVDTVE